MRRRRLAGTSWSCCRRWPVASAAPEMVDFKNYAAKTFVVTVKGTKHKLSTDHFTDETSVLPIG